MRASYRISNDHFEFYNENPSNSKSALDCTVRALGYATIGWNETYKRLCVIGYDIKDMPNSDKAIEIYLTEQGWVKNKQPRKQDNTKYKFKEFLKYTNGKKVIVRLAHHISVCDNYKIIDTWDCGNLTVGNFWTKD